MRGGSNLVDLPDEILHLILLHIDPPTPCLALERTSRRFRPVTNEPLLWRHYCKVAFRYWDGRHEIDTKFKQPASTVAWKQLFAQRWITDRETTRALDDILSNRVGRIRKAQEILDRGFDVKDTLMRHSRASLALDDWLARRYFSNQILGCLRRSTAIAEWAKLRNGEGAVPLERALGAFDLFVPQCEIDSLEEISYMLNAIVENVSQENPNILNSKPREKALMIASYLLSNNYTGIQSGRDYHRIEHSFLGLALRDPEHNSLPLISAAIFCYVAKRFGLNAQPCGFPFHVHAIILPPAGFDMDGNVWTGEGDAAPMYMDPFRSKDEVDVADLRRQLNLFGGSRADHSSFLEPSSTSDILLRCGRNIWNSLQNRQQIVSATASGNLDPDSARYAGLWSLMLSSRQGRLMQIRLYLPWFMELFFKEFPWDISLVEEYILTMVQGSAEYVNVAEGLRVTRTVDEMPKQVRRRQAEHKNVKYRVGEVFHHRRYNYQAVITGWDSECRSGEEWMMRMGVDQLQAGRMQSFYHALSVGGLVEDRSVRYVAEENIEIIRPTMSELPSQLLAIAGLHFKRWSEEERRFVSNVRDEYPDD